MFNHQPQVSSRPLPSFSLYAGKTPEEVVKKYLQKVKSPPEEVRPQFFIMKFHTTCRDKGE